MCLSIHIRKPNQVSPGEKHGLSFVYYCYFYKIITEKGLCTGQWSHHLRSLTLVQREDKLIFCSLLSTKKQRKMNILENYKCLPNEATFEKYYLLRQKHHFRTLHYLCSR